MQFKRQKNKIQVLAYRGYDKEKRRSIVKMLGSMSAYTLEPTDKLLNNLTEDEKKELQEYIDRVRRDREIVDRRRSLRYIGSRIMDAAENVGDPDVAGELLSDEFAAEIWEGIAALQKALKKAGYARPKKAKKKAEDNPKQAVLDV